jgi:hypothetical protein
MNLRRIPWSDALLLVLPAAVAWAVARPGPWSVAGLVAMAGASLAAVPGRFRWAWAALLGGIALYAMNPTHRWVEGTGLLPAKPLPGLPGSAFPRGTWNALGMAAGACSAFVLASALSARKVRILQVAAAVAGAGLAVMVLAQRLEPKPFPVFDRTAIFVYENHFAAWANLVLPVTLALGARYRFRAVQQDRMSSPAGLCFLAALLLAAAIVMSRSRAGVAVMAFGVAATMWNLRVLSERTPFAGPPRSRWREVWNAGMCLTAAVLAGTVIAREWNGLAGLLEQGAFRFAILKDALSVLRDRPAWGAGPGTFSIVFPYYQSELLQDRTFLHAHCEPVQFLMEFGWAGGGAVLAAAGIAVFGLMGRRCPDPDLPPFAELERRAFGLGLLACALHAIIDFPLRNPWIGMLAAAWAGIWVGSRIPRNAGASPAAGKGSLP